MAQWQMLSDGAPWRTGWWAHDFFLFFPLIYWGEHCSCLWRFFINSDYRPEIEAKSVPDNLFCPSPKFISILRLDRYCFENHSLAHQLVIIVGLLLEMLLLPRGCAVCFGIQCNKLPAQGHELMIIGVLMCWLQIKTCGQVNTVPTS